MERTSTRNCGLISSSRRRSVDAGARAGRGGAAGAAGVRRRGAVKEQSRDTRGHRPARCPLTGPALRLPVASPQPRLHRRRRPHPRPRHRRQRRDVRGGGPAAVPRTAFLRDAGRVHLVYFTNDERGVPSTQSYIQYTRYLDLRQWTSDFDLMAALQRASAAGRQRGRDPGDAGRRRPRRRSGISSTRHRCSAATSLPPRTPCRWERRWRC